MYEIIHLCCVFLPGTVSISFDKLQAKLVEIESIQNLLARAADTFIRDTRLC